MNEQLVQYNMPANDQANAELRQVIALHREMFQNLRAEIAGYKQVVGRCWDLARDFIAERQEADPSIAVDLDFLVGRMLREITVLQQKLERSKPCTASQSQS